MNDAYSAPEHGWTCFHCGETFKTPGAARDHFGVTPNAEPGCLIKVQLGGERGLLMALRKAETLLARYMEEDTDLYRALHSMQGRHCDALMCAEDSGYARGLKDYMKIEEQRDELREFVEYVRRNGETRLASMAIATLSRIEAGGQTAEAQAGEPMAQIKKQLVQIHTALCSLGDSDPYFPDDFTDDEIREEDPVFWAAKEIAGLIGDGSWDQYTTPSTPAVEHHVPDNVWQKVFLAVTATKELCKAATGQHTRIDTYVNATQITHDACETAQPDTEVSHTGNTWSKTFGLVDFQKLETTQGPMADHRSDGGHS
jgi:hypothetical protein